MADDRAGRWLLLIHQIPPEPAYLRVKVGRRLQSVGAVPVKASVYILPASAAALEDLQWIRREIVDGGGDASVCRAAFVEGLSDAAIEELFREARQADYEALAEEARRVLGSGGPRERRKPPSARAPAALLRLRRRFDEISAIDPFGAPGRGDLEALLAEMDPGSDPRARAEPGERLDRADFRGRRWWTRADVHVDRIASAWLIRGWIDEEASFGFVVAEGQSVPDGDLRFDMFAGEFTHEGEECTFEVLLRRFGIDDPALRQIAEVVHDVDLKDARFGRPEAAGIERLLAGLARRESDDAARLREGAELFEALYASFREPSPRERRTSRTKPRS